MNTANSKDMSKSPIIRQFARELNTAEVEKVAGADIVITTGFTAEAGGGTSTIDGTSINTPLIHIETSGT